MKNVLVIANPKAGQRDATTVLESLRPALDKASGWKAEIRETTGPGDATKWAAGAEADGFDRILAVGGDGTVAEAATGLLRESSDLPLGFVPAGTANVLSDVLRLPGTREDAVAWALAHDPLPFDVGYLPEVDRYFLIGVGIGVPGRIVENADRQAKDRLGFGAYLFAFLEGLAEGRSALIKITVDGETHTASGQSAIVANVARVDILGKAMGTRVSPHDRALDCLVLDHTDPRLLVETVSKLFGAGPKDPAGLVHYNGKRFRIEASPALSVQVDGEWIGRTPVLVELCSRPVQMIPGPEYPRAEMTSPSEGDG